MKIRPPDSSGSVPEPPDDVKQKDRSEQIAGSPTEELGESEKLARARQGETASEIVQLLGDVKDIEELGEKFIEIAVDEFEESIAPSDLDLVRQMLADPIEEDPFIQGKLERIFGLLEKAK